MDENQEKKAEKPKKEMTKRAARKIFKPGDNNDLRSQCHH